MRSDPERNWNPSRCAPPARGSCALILSHSRSASINKALRHRGDQVPEFNKKTRTWASALSLFLCKNFPSSAFVSVSAGFFCLSDFDIVALRICNTRIFVCREARWLLRLFGFRGLFLPFHRGDIIPSSLHSLLRLRESLHRRHSR